MKTHKKTDKYTVFKRNDNRFAVKDSHGKTINAEEKTKILLKEKLIKASKANPKAKKSAEEAEAAE